MHTLSRAYTSAAHNLRVTVYDTDGEYYGVYGGYGSELGKFIWPSSIAADHDENVFISGFILFNNKNNELDKSRISSPLVEIKFISKLVLNL